MHGALNIRVIMHNPTVSARRVERGERARGSFPGPRDVLGAPPSLKNTEKGVPDGFFLTSDMHKSIFGPRWGSSRRFPRLLSGGESTRLPTFPPLHFGFGFWFWFCILYIDAFGVSISAHTEVVILIGSARMVSRAPLWLLTGLVSATLLEVVGPNVYCSVRC